MGLIDKQVALDALTAQADEMSRWCERYQEQRKGVLTARNIIDDLSPSQQWIPCKTALPKTGEKVLVTCEHLDIYGKPHRYVCKAFHVDRYTMRSDVDWWDEGCDEYREEDDQYYVLEGWYECIHNWDDYSGVRIAEDKVVAWCPLPEPWKGEQE